MDRSDPTDLSKQFELTLESDRAKRGVTDLNIAAAAIRFEGLFSRLPADLRQREKEDDPKADKDSGQKPKKKRTADYQLPEAFVTEWRYSIVPPAGFRPKPLPANAQLSLGPATLAEEFSADKDGLVRATLRFDTVKRRLPVPETTELRNTVAELIAGEPILIYFEPIGQNTGQPGQGARGAAVLSGADRASPQRGGSSSADCGGASECRAGRGGSRRGPGRGQTGTDFGAGREDARGHS